MKIYGTGTLDAPGTRRVIWDFTDGVFDSVNPDVVAAARKKGCWIGEEAVRMYELEKATAPAPEPKAEPVGEPVKARRKKATE